MTAGSGTTMVHKPRVEHGVVDYRPSTMQQRVIELLTKPESMAVLAPLIPKDVDREAVAIEVYRAVTKNPAILECTETSIIMAVADCVQVGLTIGKTIHLVPVRPERGAKQELQAWTDYKGDIELVQRSGAAKLVYAEPVYEKDKFRPILGDDPRIEHEPEYLGPRGRLIGAYAIARINNTLRKVCWMRLDQIEKIRAKSKQWKPEKVKECPDWYACKTAIHRLCKDLPKSPKLAAVLARFERDDYEDHGAPVAVDDGGPLTFAPPPDDEIVTGEIENADRQPAVETATTTVSEAGATETAIAPPPPTAASAPTAPVRDLAWAKAFAFPLKQWPQYGTPIGTFSYQQLQEFEAWILENRRAKNLPDRHEELLAAVRLVMESLEDPTPTGDADDDAPPPAKAAPPANATTATNATTLRPGKLEDALTRSDAKPSAVAPPAPTAAADNITRLRELTRTVKELLRDPKLIDADLPSWERRFERADTVEKLEALRVELENVLQQPF
jgi:recombination protein RecT